MAVASHSVAMKDPADRGFLWNEQLYAALDPAAVAGVTLHPYLHLGDAVTGEGPRAKGERQLAHGQQRRKIVVVEVGAGFNTPTVTRFPAEVWAGCPARLVARWAAAAGQRAWWYR